MDANAHVLTHDQHKLRLTEYLDRAEWLRARRKLIVSTDLAGITGMGRFATPLSVYAEKVREDSPEDAIDTAEERMMLGTIFQRSIAEAYQNLRRLREVVAYEIEHVPQFTLFGHATNHRHGTSLDCWQRAMIEYTPLEVKMTTAFPEQPFDEWLTQVQWQMYVTGSPRATIAALCGGEDLRWWDIERDEDVIGMLRTAADEFLAVHVDPRNPPPSEGKGPSRQAMRKLFLLSEPGVEVTLTAEDYATTVGIQTLNADIAKLEEEKGALEDSLKQKMGEAEVAYLPNGGKITWKSFEKAGYTVKPQMARPFRIWPPPVEKGRGKRS